MHASLLLSRLKILALSSSSPRRQEPKPMASNQTPPNPDEPQSPINKVLKPYWGHTYHATRDIKSGERIFTDRRIAMYPTSISSIDVSCSGCYENLPPETFPCQVCNARFCSTRCLQLGHSSLLCHSVNHLRTLDLTLQPDLIYLLSAYSLPTNLLNEFLSIRSRSQFKPDGVLVETLHSEMSLLIGSNPIPFFSTENTHNLLSKKKIFSFPKVSTVHQLEVCGAICAYAIYIKPPILRHSCKPNVGIFSDYIGLPHVDNQELTCRALHRIREGSEIIISYIPLRKGFTDRQISVRELLGKNCDCMRCRVESKWQRNQDANRTITRGAEREAPKDRDWIPIPEFLRSYVCACGGCLAYFAPADRKKYHRLRNLKECSRCGAIKFVEADGQISRFRWGVPNI